ncbi:MAG: D-glycero-beta-D-manno-heptose-7-phosphate kinase [Alphaproteobacteria bacterium]
MSEASELAALVDRLSRTRLLCIGDLMLDRYVYGIVERTSPEAPIPVLRVEKESVMLGGAGNVIRNIVSLGASSCLLSVVGDDDTGRRLTAMVGAEPRIEPYLLVEPGRPSTTKTRFIAEGQQLLRADREETVAIGAPTRQNLLRIATDSLTNNDVVVLSDYGKGLLTDEVLAALIGRARAAAKPVVVDPKGRDFARYRGAEVVTPNRRELGEATGLPTESDAEIVAAAEALMESAEIGAVLVTRSQDGMSLIARDGTIAHLPAHARSVFDVSGAGDTVVATFAAALGQQIPMTDAARLANAAAGIVVGKTGTATAEAWELVQTIKAEAMPEGSKIQSLDEARASVARWRKAGERVGFTNGCFDLLHPGHVSLLRHARSHCDRLIVALNADESVRRLKGPDRPVQLEAARAELLASLEMVDLVMIFREDTPMALIEALRPDILVKGSDYSIEQVVGAELVQGYGGEVVLAPIAVEHSTSNTIAKLRRA